MCPAALSNSRSHSAIGAADEQVADVECHTHPKQIHTDHRTLHPNFFRGSDFFFPPLPPAPPLPPRPLPRPLPRPRAPFLLNGTKPASPATGAGFASPSPPPSAPGTAASRGRRYFGICFMCDCTRVGCSGLSCRKYSRSSGLSSKCAYEHTTVNNKTPAATIHQALTFSLSEFRISVLSSLMRASLIALRVTARSASSMR